MKTPVVAFRLQIRHKHEQPFHSFNYCNKHRAVINTTNVLSKTHENFAETQFPE